MGIPKENTAPYFFNDFVLMNIEVFFSN